MAAALPLPATIIGRRRCDVILVDDPHGELSLRFGGFQQGLAYGVRWELPAAPE